MERGNKPQFTIGQVLVFTAVVGGGIVLLMNGSMIPVLASGIATLMVLAVFMYAGSEVLDGLSGRICTNCGTGKLQRIAVSTFGARYFRCDHCRARWKRSPMGLWEPAEGEEDTMRYASKEIQDPWSSPPGSVEGEPVAWSETHTTLLHNKKKRNPNAPRQEKNAPRD